MLQRWVSADPLEVHAPGQSGEPNVYAYVSGRALKATDPLGLCGDDGAEGCPNATQEDLARHAEASKPIEWTDNAGMIEQIRRAKAEAASSGGTGGTAADVATSERKFKELKAASGRLEIQHNYYIDVEHEVMPEHAERAQAYGGAEGAGSTEELPQVPRMTLHIGTVDANVLESGVSSPGRLATTALVKYDGEFAARQLLGRPPVTPGGRQINSHAAERMVMPPKGRAAMTMEEVDKVLDTADKIRKVSAHAEGTTVTVQSTKMPGKPQVVVDAATGKRVITVVKKVK